MTVALTPGSFSSLNILAYAIYGDQPSQTFQVNYTNGTYSTVTQSISDWGIPGNYSGETKVATMAYRNTSSGGENSGTTTLRLRVYPPGQQRPDSGEHHPPGQ